MNLKLLVIICALSISALLSAQGDFQKGYVITNASDTISGYIDLTNAKLSALFCYYKSDLGSDDITIYHPEEIFGYGFESGKLYLSKEVKLNNTKPQTYFLEILLQGRVNLYFLRVVQFDYYVIEKDGQIAELTNEYKNKGD